MAMEINPFIQKVVRVRPALRLSKRRYSVREVSNAFKESQRVEWTEWLIFALLAAVSAWPIAAALSAMAALPALS